MSKWLKETYLTASEYLWVWDCRNATSQQPSALHCSQESLASSLLLGSAWWRMEGIQLSAGQRLLTCTLPPTNPKGFWLTGTKVIFHCLVSLRYKLRICFPLFLLDIANNTDCSSNQYFCFQNRQHNLRIPRKM